MPARSASAADYRALAEFRYRIRLFLSFSENAARSAGIEPQQHQALLALKGLPDDMRPTIKSLATRLCVQHHSAVALVDNMEARKLVRRVPSQADRREVLLALTATGERLLRRLSVLHREQLRTVAPTLVDALAPLLIHNQGRRAGPAKTRRPARLSPSMNAAAPPAT